jgi:hypothetical protein
MAIYTNMFYCRSSGWLGLWFPGIDSLPLVDVLLAKLSAGRALSGGVGRH